MAIETKRTLLFRLYQILYDYSDSTHPLKQQDVINLLNKNYDIEIERKAIGRNLSFLREMGYEIHSDRNGSYLEDKQFENAELRLLIDSVLSSRHISEKYSKDLINKLIKLGGVHFKPHVKHIYSVSDWGKSENKDLFLNIDLIDEAIETNKKIIFDYNKLGIDKQPHKTYRHVVSPYQMILHNQHYYLMSYNKHWEDMRFYRIDKMTNMQILEEHATPIREIKGYENGIDYSELANARPYMFTDKPERITLKCQKFLVDDIADWFGLNFTIKEIDEEYIEVSLMASPSSMVYWGVQYGDNAQIIEPISLRERVKNMLKYILNKYE